MSESGFDMRLQQASDQLDELAARATRAAAQLRAQGQSILDDVEAWKQHLDQLRIDTELARMDARDELGRARSVFRECSEGIERRLGEFRAESTEAWRSLRACMDDALRELRETVDAPSSCTS
jgi:hypothetical protein